MNTRLERDFAPGADFVGKLGIAVDRDCASARSPWGGDRDAAHQVGVFFGLDLARWQRISFLSERFATRAAYRSDFAMFRAWCEGKGVSALPASPATVAAFLAHEADRGSRAATITRRCAAIRFRQHPRGHRS
jgi:hypothetical protein